MAAPRTAAMVASSSTIPAYARTAGRAVHIKIQPRPLNVGESRQILRTLERYGEVIMYKHLKHDPDIRAPNTALAIFGTSEAASRALNASPLHFDVSRSPSSSSSSSATPEEAAWDDDDEGSTAAQEEGRWRGELDNDDKDDNNNNNTPPSQREATPSNHPQHPLPTSLHLSPSNLNHPAYLHRQHYHSRFTLETRSIMGQDLADRVSLPGLADLRWHVREVPLRIRNLRAEEERREGRGWWRKGLGDVWREGEERRRRREEEEEEEEEEKRVAR